MHREQRQSLLEKGHEGLRYATSSANPCACADSHKGFNALNGGMLSAGLLDLILHRRCVVLQSVAGTLQLGFGSRQTESFKSREILRQPKPVVPGFIPLHSCSYDVY